MAFQPFLVGSATTWTMRQQLETNSVPQLFATRIANGDSHVILVASDDVITEAIAFNDLQPDLFEMYALGYIEYTDSTGKHPRRTGFIRLANLRSRSFERVDNPDFEYQD